MSRSLTFAYPGRLEMKTGGYAYDRRVIAGLADLGWTVRPLPLGDGFPFPSPDARAEAGKSLSGLPDGATVIVDGLAFGVLDDWAEREANRLAIIALVHHPLALETGLDADQQARFRASERRALSSASHIVVTSPMTAGELVRSYGVDEAKITIAVPGTDPVPERARRASGHPPHILSIGTLIRRKGHDVLIAALKAVEDLDWTATIVGSRTLDPPTAAALERQIRDLGLGHRVALAGECEDTGVFLANADIFALASRYEGYGMVFAEALAHGLPIVACRAGAVPDVVPEDAGILAPVDDVAVFAAGLRQVLSDPDVYRRRAGAACRAGAVLPGWEVTARIIADSLEALS